MSQALEAIIKSLNNNPHEWEHRNHGAHTLYHKSGLDIWIDNVPVINTNVYHPSPLSLNLWQKYRLYKATKNVGYSKILELLK